MAWAEHFDIFQQFSWIDLKKFPDWNTVKTSAQLMCTKTSFDLEANSSKIFQQYGLLKSICSDEKISECNVKNEEGKTVSTESRWVQIFQHMHQHQLPFEEFSHLIEFILCIPGTSAPVERVTRKVSASSINAKIDPDCEEQHGIRLL